MVRVAIFDAYGTLFDVASAARRLAAEPGREAFAAIWDRVAADWRTKQLSYTWLRAVTGAHADFRQVTGESLDWALDAAAIDDPALRARLMDLYWTPDAYPEAAEALGKFRDTHLATGILSNGTPQMLEAAVETAGLHDLLDTILSVEAAGVFKPAHAAYDLVGRTFGVPAGDVLFISSNGWDAACATGYGFRTIWVNRSNEPKERLPWEPEWCLPDLSGAAEIATCA